MTVLCPFAARERFQMLGQAQAFVWMRLAAFNCDVAGLRWMMVALVVQWLGAAGAMAQRQLGRLANDQLRRAWRGACFAQGLAAADTTVAAASR